MKFKKQVLARFPDAHLVVDCYWPAETQRFELPEPRYMSVRSGELRLDVHNPDDGVGQLHGRAWRSAYYWMIRNPAEIAKLGAALKP